MAAGGGDGKFQKLNIFIIMVSTAGLQGMFVNAFPFYSVTPFLLCKENLDDENEEWTRCTREQACGEDDSDFNTFKVDYSHPETITNWVTDLGLLCDPNFKRNISFFGFSLLLGFFTGSLFVTPLLDIHGRRIVNIWSTICMIISLTICFSTTNYWVVLLSIFLTAVAMVARYSLAMLYCQEFTTFEFKSHIGALYLAMMAFANFSISIVFQLCQSMRF